MARNALPILTAEPGLAHYLEEIRRVPDVGAAGRIYASQALARARRSGRGAQGRHQPSAARDQDRQGLSRLRPADLRGDLRGQCRPDAGGRAVPAGEGLPVRHLRRVVDQGGDPGIHPALVVAGEDGHHGQPEEGVLQPPQGPEQNLRIQRWRYAAGRGIRRLARARAPDRGERLREGAEGSQAPRRGDGHPGVSADALASNPLPWWEKLTMDVSLWVRFNPKYAGATNTRSKATFRR